MQATGLSRDKVLARLKQAREEDLKYEEGKILCSMCTTPLPAAKAAQQMFSDSNLGDPGLFPGSAKLETEAVASLAELLHGNNSAGFIVSGGTEANLLAVYAARNRAEATAPEVVLPESAHFSFSKICDMLRIKPVYAMLDADFKVSVSDVEEHITKNTVAIVGNAGSAELGVVDPIAELSAVAMRRGIHLHVDAAFGGLVIPFLKELGFEAPAFDFELDGVQSITVDPHKMGQVPIPAGGILFRNNTFLKLIKTETPYLTEPSQYTFVGTRPGASAAATWAALASSGRDGYRKKVKHCMDLTLTLSETLEAEDFEVLLRPTMNIVAFRSPKSRILAEKLRQKGWFVSYVPRLDCIRVVLMPHLRKRHVEAFLKCLVELR